MPIYFTNYCPSAESCRASEIRVHFRLKDAREFMKDKRGYIIRQSDPETSAGKGENTFQEWCGNFTPTAQDEQTIKSLLDK